jgi:hypothetical protein
MQNATRKLMPQPGGGIAATRPTRVPRPSRAPRPADPVPAENSTESVAAIRRELDAFAQQCRAFADACEETSRRLQHDASEPVSAVSEKLCLVRDTLPEDTLELADSDAVPDWEEDDVPTSQWPRIQGPTTWECPVVEPARLASPPSEVLRPCPSCGHRNGLQYHACTVCGGGLVANESAVRARSSVDPATPLNALIDWIRRLDPRRPRLEPEALAPRT